MSLIQRLLRALGYSRPPRLSFQVEEEWIRSLHDISQREQRSAEEIAAEMFANGLLRRQDAAAVDLQWSQLSPREKQVVALICLKYTNSQIAHKLGISIETVRTHSTNAKRKFEVRSKSDLMIILAGYDFTGWD